MRELEKVQFGAREGSRIFPEGGEVAFSFRFASPRLGAAGQRSGVVVLCSTCVTVWQPACQEHGPTGTGLVWCCAGGARRDRLGLGWAATHR